jgi:formylglycine-generating enzyme required for sulfatase activity
VDEWCDDVADNSAYRTFQGIVVVNPQKLRHDESTCIFRGGNFLLSAAKCRSASRNNSFPGLQGRLIGFRAVLSVAGVKQMLEKDGGGLERK